MFVDVLVRAPDEPGTGHPAWIVRLKAPVRCTLMLYQRGGAPTRIRIVNVPAGGEACIRDDNLQPIRPSAPPKATPAPPREVETT